MPNFTENRFTSKTRNLIPTYSLLGPVLGSGNDVIIPL